MDRRTFITLAAGVLCLSSQTARSAVNLPFETRTDESFPISLEDYREVAAEYLPQLVSYDTDQPRGTLIVDPDHRFLYLVLGEGRAKRYGIGVGREGFGWAGTAVIKRKAKWPSWLPPEEMQARDKEAAQWREGMPGGPNNPLGARALYLYQGEADTLYRIHGTREPASIGRAVSSGCIRMLNSDIIELYERVHTGTKVVVLPSGATPVARDEQGRTAKQRKEALRAEKPSKAVDLRTVKRSDNADSIFEMFGVGQAGD
jgi:lipoprotein-anchoring transpeptidase ErfK/SrfK